MVEANFAQAITISIIAVSVIGGLVAAWFGARKRGGK